MAARRRNTKRQRIGGVPLVKKIAGGEQKGLSCAFCNGPSTTEAWRRRAARKGGRGERLGPRARRLHTTRDRGEHGHGDKQEIPLVIFVALFTFSSGSAPAKTTRASPPPNRRVPCLSLSARRLARVAVALYSHPAYLIVSASPYLIPRLSCPGWTGTGGHAHSVTACIQMSRGGGEGEGSYSGDSSHRGSFTAPRRRRTEPAARRARLVGWTPEHGLYIC